MGARKTFVFHNSRGRQEGIFAELKSDNALGYVFPGPWLGNRIYLLSGLLAHNLDRELQMMARDAGETAGLLAFKRLDRFRGRIL